MLTIKRADIASKIIKRAIEYNSEQNDAKKMTENPSDCDITRTRKTNGRPEFECLKPQAAAWSFCARRKPAWRMILHAPAPAGP